MANRQGQFEGSQTDLEHEAPIQHDSTEGGVIGAVGGAIIGGLAGGPVGALVGAVVAGSASAAAVDIVEKHHNEDENVTGPTVHESVNPWQPELANPQDTKWIDEGYGVGNEKRETAGIDADGDLPIGADPLVDIAGDSEVKR